ncbi:MaoC/PaaZ C-terminal domain-containing protein [Amycolatopsis nigrescens]|uniref:MaoC family dehydratase n=1 Tax=Amycolatopsis nigrescens TaxID=381445 RepID=UPI0003654009|nr:MaoC/PaaZ C-terminal domain-containing protein [Amycolatopsis nigrescens]
MTEKGAIAYAEATGDDPARSVDRGFAPPMYAVRLIAGLWRAVYQDPVLGTADQLVLHAEQRMLFAGDLRIGAQVHAHGWVKGMIGFGFGDAALIRNVIADETGRVLVSMECTLAIQGSSDCPPDGRRARALDRGEQVCTESRLLDEHAPHRYADAADDHNPLHLDDELARTAGHPCRIVHGMCTLATGFAALSERLLRDPDDRVRYLRARFSRPVLPGSEVTYSAHTTGAAGTYALSASCGGRPVLKNTWLRLAGQNR